MPHDIQYCQWCEIAQASIEYKPTEPIQLGLLNKTIVAIHICQGCLNDVQEAETYNLIS